MTCIHWLTYGTQCAYAVGMENYLNDPVLAWLHNGADGQNIPREVVQELQPIMQRYPKTRTQCTWVILYLLHTYGAMRWVELRPLLPDSYTEGQLVVARDDIRRHGYATLSNGYGDTHLTWRLAKVQ